MRRTLQRVRTEAAEPSAEALLRRLDALEREARQLAQEIRALYEQLGEDRAGRPTGPNGARAGAAGERLEHVIGVYEAGVQVVDALRALESAAAHEKRPAGRSRRGAQ